MIAIGFPVDREFMSDAPYVLFKRDCVQVEVSAYVKNFMSVKKDEDEYHSRTTISALGLNRRSLGCCDDAEDNIKK